MGRDGFSLAEVLLAVALLALIGIASTGLIGGLTKGSVRTRDRVLAHGLAAERMENALAGGYATLSLGSSSESSITGFEGFQARRDVFQEATDLRRVKVVVWSPTAADSLETLVANRY